LRAMKSRWGSCAYKKGLIPLNPRLYHAPRECLEYVALHELCHFVHPDHSPAFHSLMAVLMPDYKARKRALEAWSSHAHSPIPQGAQAILSALEQAGFEAYLVGGCVRDLLRGVTPQDWDICTSALPEQTKVCFAQERLIETGLKHGTVTVLLDGQGFEITTYRADGPYSDGRRPDSVAFVPDLDQDLSRRDFTVNAMAMDLRGQLRDPFGGRGDLERRVIRCVGGPDRRFQEDGLRLMRALRFSSTLDYAIAPATAAAIRRNLPMLDHVAAERVQAELRKLLMGPRCVEILRQFPEVFCRFWPELEPLVALEQHTPWHCYGGWEHTLHALAAAPEDLCVRLAVLLHDIGKPACKTTDDQGLDHFYGHAAVSAQLSDDMLRALKFDNATRERVVTLVERHDLPLQPTPASVRRWLGRLGDEAFFQLLAVKRCDCAGHAPETVPARLADLDTLETLARDVIAQGQCFSLKDLAVNGQDALVAGVAPGPQVGQALATLLDAVTAGTLPNDRDVLLSELELLARR
ncbi:MAG: DUF45 domain-containing protein, partial [Muribaculaceae bacterium]|nr:DUF45 domain-containing protein [Muribaculaceae bacterium]